MWFHLMQKNFSENFSSVEVDDYTHEYLIRIPEWIINEMNWYDGTEVNIKLDGEEIIIPVSYTHLTLPTMRTV